MWAEACSTAAVARATRRRRPRWPASAVAERDRRRGRAARSRVRARLTSIVADPNGETVDLVTVGQSLCGAARGVDAGLTGLEHRARLHRSVVGGHLHLCGGGEIVGRIVGRGLQTGDRRGPLVDVGPRAAPLGERRPRRGVASIFAASATTLAWSSSALNVATAWAAVRARVSSLGGGGAFDRRAPPYRRSAWRACGLPRRPRRSPRRTRPRPRRRPAAVLVAAAHSPVGRPVDVK